MKEKRYFYDNNTQDFITLEGMRGIYNYLVRDEAIDADEMPFEAYLADCTSKNGTLTEVFGSLFVTFFDGEGERSIEFDHNLPNEAMMVYDGILNSENCGNVHLVDGNGQRII